MNIESIEIKAIDAIKTNRFTQPIYKILKTKKNQKKFKVESINSFSPIRTDYNEVRFNLILPTLRKTRVFAGISSALSFFCNLTCEKDNCRIIIIGNEEYDDRMTYNVQGYKHDKGSKKQLVFFRDSSHIEIGINDVFVFTSWKTAFSFIPILKWQQGVFSIPNRKAIYLIQDYEPGFFPWSSEYVLAESTYSDHPEDIVAVFNSAELYNYFINADYYFADSFYFKPVLNEKLKEVLLKKRKASKQKRKKQILIYGRPSEERNIFEIIRYALKEWSIEYPHSNEWEIIALGEGFSDIKLVNNTIVSKGKVTLDAYADYMLEAYAGISLMVSPHPSYPPLEMSTFGVRTITNKFAGKDLSYFNNNIISLDKCSPRLIVETLSRICDEYEDYCSDVALNEEYLNGKGILDITEKLRKTILG